MFFWDLVHHLPAGVSAVKAPRDGPILAGPIAATVLLARLAQDPLSFVGVGLGALYTAKGLEITASELEKQEHYKFQDTLATIAVVAARYEHELEHEPSNATVHARRAVAALILGEYSTSVEHFAKACKIAPEISEYREGHVIALTLAEEWDEALSRASELVAAAPKSYLGWLSLGVILGKLNRPEDAIKASDLAIEQNATIDTAWVNKGIALDDLGKHDEAFRCFQVALSCFPQLEIDELYTRWLERGRSAASASNHTEAILCFERAMCFASKNVEAHVGHARSLNALDKHEAALQSWTKAAALDPNVPLPWVQLTARGLDEVRAGRSEAAIKFYDQALRFNAQHAQALFSKGIALKVVGRLDESIESFIAATGVQPGLAMAWYNLAEIHGNFGRYDDALAACDKFLELEPRSKEGWMKRGAALAELGRIGLAIQAFTRADELKHPYALAGAILCSAVATGTHVEPLRSGKGKPS